MAIYTCPTCNEKMERDLSLFMDHTDKHIVDEVKRLHPNWVTDDGFCPDCLEYYKKARLGEADNLDAKGVLQRLVLGIVGISGAVAVWFWLQSTGAPRIGRLALFFLFFAGILGLIQAKKKFCVVIAQKQAAAMRRRALKIIFFTLVAAAILTAVAYYF